MSLRGKAAIVGFSELPTLRNYPGRTTNSLCSEAIRLAIADAGLTKDDVDGLITRGTDVVPTGLAEYYGLKVSFNTGVTQHGSSGAHSVALAAAAINSGLANTVVCVFGGTRDPGLGGLARGVVRGTPPASKGSEFQAPFGLAPSITTSVQGGMWGDARMAARRLAWERLARSLLSCVSSSHRSNSVGPNRSRGSISRTTR